jgi:hypothetical protein
MTRYVPSRSYAVLAVIALALGALSTWIAFRWLPSAVPAGLFLATSGLNFYLALRPTIELGARTIIVGDKEFLWSEIGRIERTGWVSPLVVRLIFKDGGRLVLIYPGALEGSRRLADELMRRLSRSRETAAQPARALAHVSRDSDRRPLLTAEDEADVERLFQRLKSVGHLESDEK